MAVFAIWLPMLYGDGKDKIDSRMFDDPRVTTFWDGERIAGNWFGQHAVGGLGGDGYTVWDAFYGFDGTARWGATPTGVVATGSTIIGSTSALQSRFVPLLR